MGGVRDLLDIAPKARIYKNSSASDWFDIQDGQMFVTEGATLRAFHCPGHTTDHMALILEDEDAMFTGDNVLGQGTAVFEDLATYVDSLDRMSRQFSGRAYPGHGPVIEDGKAKVLEYIQHRKQREDQVLEVLGRANGGAEANMAGWKSMEIVKVIYKNYPEKLHAPAERGVLQVLEKLVKEGKVLHDDREGTWSLRGKTVL